MVEKVKNLLFSMQTNIIYNFVVGTPKGAMTTHRNLIASVSGTHLQLVSSHLYVYCIYRLSLIHDINRSRVI